MGVLVIRILLFRYHIRVPYFRELPCFTQAFATIDPEAWAEDVQMLVDEV